AGAPGRPPAVGGPRRGGARLRSAGRPSCHRGPRGRHTRWVARDEARPGSVPHGAPHSTGGRGAATLGGWPATRRGPAPFRMALLIPPEAVGPPHSVGGPRRGAARLRSAWRSSFHRRPRGRHTRWVARDEARPGSVPHGAPHSTGGRWAATLGGWPATRRGPAPFRMALLIPPEAAGPPHSVGGL